jgi:hypothetical protein
MSMPDGSIKELLASSSLAFAGTVEAVGATTVAGIPVDGRTVIVQVDELLHGPPEMALPAGSRVTVQLSPELPALTAGERAAFFTNGWVYGESLAVVEAGRSSVGEAAGRTGQMAGLEAPVSSVQVALAELAQDEVVQHAREAEAIVRGRAVGLTEVPSAGLPREHDPDWWIATLEVDLVERGELPGVMGDSGTVAVLYANSIDVHWRESPKPKASQAGLWLLHRTPDELAELAPFQLIHPIDLQPSIQLDLLRERGI